LVGQHRHTLQRAHIVRLIWQIGSLIAAGLEKQARDDALHTSSTRRIRPEIRCAIAAVA
jgi:hypothetical protein